MICFKKRKKDINNVLSIINKGILDLEPAYKQDFDKKKIAGEDTTKKT